MLCVHMDVVQFIKVSTSAFWQFKKNFAEKKHNKGEHVEE